MTENKFGDQLRTFRSLCRHIETGKSITQNQFAEYLYTEINILYSGTAISDWELGKSKIGVNDRRLLNAIIKILKQHGGIKTPSEANLLLESGNYRALNPSEQKDFFPDALPEDKPQPANKNQEASSLLYSFISHLFFDSLEEFEHEREKASQGPPPALPRLVVAIIRKRTDRISPVYFWNLILWAWIIVGTYWLIVPSFQFPLDTKQDAFNTMVLYVSGTLVLPFAIGLMNNTKDNPFWKAQNLQKSWALRLYVLQGSYVGFHVAYFLVFLPTFILDHLQLQLGMWFELLKILFIIVVSYASAQLIPYNFWLVYKRLDLNEGKILFSFVLLGPFWAWFFLEFYEMLTSPILGTTIILISITLVVIIEMRKKHN